jgi:tRNA threonylcarbamoyladenosine biosynthesis protein TsaB
MLSLAQLLARHDRILVLDAASTRVQVGILRRDSPAIWHAVEREAGESLFTLTDACLQEAGLSLRDVQAFTFCAGPGSMLGVRIVAMALRTWQALQTRPAYEFLSLSLLAHEIDARPALVIADARRDSWHAVALSAQGEVGPLQRLSTREIGDAPLPLWQSSAFRSWSAPPREAHDCAYELPKLFERHAAAPLFSPAPNPDTFQHEAPEYKKWSAQVHSANTARPR